jgi:hypothetical protein
VKVLKVMVLEKSLDEVEGRTPEPLPLPILHSAYVSILALLLLALGIYWNPLAEASSEKGINNFHPVPAAAVAQLEPAKGAP